MSKRVVSRPDIRSNIIIKLSSLMPASVVLMLGLFLAACNNNGGGGAEAEGPLPFASGSTPLPESNNPVVQGQMVTGITSTVADATINVIDGEGASLFFEQGDGQASYSVIIPPGTLYPVLVMATNGVDLVTGLSPVISMMSVIEGPGDTTVNLNPVTTLIVKTAQAMPGGINAPNLELANQYIVSSLNFGLDVVRSSNPISVTIDEGNISSIVKAGRVLTETLHRSVVELGLAGTAMTEDELLDALAADMVDGKPDGVGAPGADPFLSALMNVVLAQVLLESISNTLQVDGLPVAERMDSAIRTILPSTQIGIADVAVSDETLAHIKVLIHAAQPVTPSDDNELSTIRSVIASLGSNMLPADIEPLLPVYGSAAFDSAIKTLISGNNGAVYQAVLSAFSDAHEHRMIALSWYPAAEADGYIVHAGPTPETATEKVLVVPRASVELDVQTDLGLNPGDNVCFRIKAFNTLGASDFSGAVCAVI